MKRFLAAASLGCLIPLMAFGESRADPTACTVDPLPLARKIDTQGHMTVKSGKGCGINIYIPGAIKSITLLQRPKFGRAGLQGSTVFYVAKPGFQGQDEYSYNYTGIDNYGAEMDITIHEKVDVLP